ncbi:hypothetical protein [Mucilaginibacter sp.]|uniref:hypothetical protein n=1 Tax=Mucilaginibacter sp. TaxID=1882438 RepID=UPI0035BC8F19
MKHFYFFLILIFLFGCTPTPQAIYTKKPMPASEIAFIKKVTSTDSIFQSQKNDITKNEYLKTGKKKMEDYILKNLEIKDWVVKVHEITVDSAAIAYIKVTMFVPIGDWREVKVPEYSFPILTTLLADKNSKLKNQIKALEVGDEVYISGKIIKNLSGGITIIDYTEGEREDSIFSNLALDFHLTDIKRIH